MFGPANGESNNLELEKIYCMLILQIRMRFDHLNYRDMNNYFIERGEGGSRAPQDHPLATPL